MLKQIENFLKGKKDKQKTADGLVPVIKAGKVIPSARDIIISDAREVTSDPRVQFFRNSGLFFSPGDDQLWKEWVDSLEKPEERDLIKLLGQDVGDGLKARAIYLLLVPDMINDFSRNPAPVFWKGELRPLVSISAETNLFKNLFPKSPKLLSFAAGLIVLFLPKVEELKDPFNSFAYHFYCITMISLMGLIPLAEARKLLMHLPLNNYSAWADTEGSSGYFPFSVLIDRKDIPDELKFLAADRMKEIIRSEQEGRTSPREWYEDALGCFASIIQLHLRSTLPFGVEFFAEQMGFLVGMESFDDSVGVPNGIERYHRHEMTVKEPFGLKTNKQIISSFNIPRMLKVLNDNRYKHLRYGIVRFVVLENGKEKFRILGSDDLEIARMMLKEVEGSGDNKLIAALNKIIVKGEEYLFRKAKQEQSEKSKEKQLLAQMV